MLMSTWNYLQKSWTFLRNFSSCLVKKQLVQCNKLQQGSLQSVMTMRLKLFPGESWIPVAWIWEWGRDSRLNRGQSTTKLVFKLEASGIRPSDPQQRREMGDGWEVTGPESLLTLRDEPMSPSLQMLGSSLQKEQAALPLTSEIKRAGLKRKREISP